MNKQTINNKVLLPRIDEVWDKVCGAKYFSTPDLRSGHHQVRMKNTDVPKTALRTRHEQFEYETTTVGLAGAPDDVLKQL